MRVIDKQYLTDMLDLAVIVQFWCVSWPHDGQEGRTLTSRISLC